MPSRLLLATAKGIIVSEKSDNEWVILEHTLQNHPVTCVAAKKGLIVAGTKNGVFRSVDTGASWQNTSMGMHIRHVRWLAFHPENQNVILAGTEPAGIQISCNGAQSWRNCPEVEILRNKKGWFLPYSPEAGCVRDFSFHGDNIYAAVEVGGVLHSCDGGESWGLFKGSNGNPYDLYHQIKGAIHPDVHSIIVHKADAAVGIAVIDIIKANPQGIVFYRLPV